MKLGRNKNIHNYAGKFIAMSKKCDNTVQLLTAVSEWPRRRKWHIQWNESCRNAPSETQENKEWKL